MVGKNLRRAIAVTAAVVAAMATAAGPASAAETRIPSPNCDTTFLADGVGGYTISVAGRSVRVPKAEDVVICVRANVIGIDTSPVKFNSGCGSTCFDVFAPAWFSGGTISANVCFTVDGVRDCVPDGTIYTIGMPQPCIASVGRPAQQTPSRCLVVVDEDPAQLLP